GRRAPAARRPRRAPPRQRGRPALPRRRPLRGRARARDADRRDGARRVGGPGEAASETRGGGETGMTGITTEAVLDAEAAAAATAPVAGGPLPKRYGERTAADRLSFEARAGRVTAFLGPNGAGKTTTLRILLGLVKATAGEATIRGRPYAELVDPPRAVGAV